METEVQNIGSADVAQVQAGSTDSAEGSGEAYDAMVVTESNVTRLERELSEARAVEEAEAPQRIIKAAGQAVETAKAHLAGAEDSLRQAREDVQRDAEAAKAANAAKAEQAAADEAAATEQEGI